MGNGFIFKKINQNIKERKKSWGSFRIYQLISTANRALFEWNWADLLIDPKRPLGSFSLFYTLIFIYFLKYV